MVKVRYRRESGRIVIDVSGHAGGVTGQDVLCAAVSAVLQAALIFLIDLAKQHPDNINVYEDPYLVTRDLAPGVDQPETFS